MDEDYENALLNKIKNREGNTEENVFELAVLYQRMGSPEEAVPYIQELINNTDDSERIAQFYTNLGQLMEQIQDFKSAISFYSKALAIGTSDKRGWYFIHNNLGFCLNVTGKYVEGEKFCKEAINIDPFPPNAYKNMGISLEGQGRILEAAMAYRTGWIADPFDGRSYQHLTSLLSKHKEYEHVFPKNQREFIMERKKFIESHGGTYDTSSIE